MALIDRAGTFRGDIVDRAVTQSSGGFPQLELQLKAAEFYDEDEQQWVDWSTVDEKDITAWLILFDGKDKQTFHVKQIEKIFAWDGVSFVELNEINIEDVKIQFRVAKNIYEGNENYKVEWIDEYDATPGRTVRKLDADELKTLQAKYKSHLKGKAPASASKAAPKAAPKAPPKAPPRTSAAPSSNVPVGKCTKAEAWDACTDKDLWAKDVTDETVSQSWQAALAEITPNKTDAKVTPEEWFLIKERVFQDILVF